ncbi:acyl-ACP desaturase [Mycobacterium nebraskense]|uniref:acyl-ACP desaturase n=1 Tax=Mycobacterium nebraskense TaxID=244292 RepID=UPI0006420B0F|nr:acyl-ACP desaturase [Mycobacterium nebraskense]KLO46470.1 acyl-ACP desaturase [Mycobacterium nebraskense]
MPQEHVASPLMLELEPVVTDTYSRHIETATPWYPHDFVPFDRGQNFKSLGGHDWDPSQVTLPDHVIDALEIMLITKDGLVGQHHRLAEHFILAGWWGKWVGRWAADENLHAFALRQNLVLTRQIDPIVNEMVRVEHVTKGQDADDHTQVEAMVLMALRECAHAVFLRRLATRIDEPVLRRLVDVIAADDERHEMFFAEIVRACLRIVPAATIAAIVARALELEVVGADIDGYEGKVRNVASSGIFGQDILRDLISDRIKKWNLAELPELSNFVVA